LLKSTAVLVFPLMFLIFSAVTILPCMLNTLTATSLPFTSEKSIMKLPLLGLGYTLIALCKNASAILVVSQLKPAGQLMFCAMVIFLVVINKQLPLSASSVTVY